MSIIVAKKGKDYYLVIPAIDKALPELYLTGETVIDEAYSKTGAGVWTSLNLSDSMTEIGTTGMYEMDITAAENNVDQLLVKFTGAGMADDAVMFDMQFKLVSDLNDFDPANDTVALVDTVLNIPASTVPPPTVPPPPATPTDTDGRVATILLNVRDSLSDPDAERYSQERLLRLLDKAQKDLNIRAKILRDRVPVQLEPFIRYYELPDGTRLLTQINNPNGRMELISHDEAEDRFGMQWTTDTGVVALAAIYDRQNQQNFMIYPTQEEPQGEDTLYTYLDDDVFGTVALADGFTFPDFGIYINDFHATFDSIYGVLATMLETFDGLLLDAHVLVNPKTLTITLDTDTNEYVYSSLDVPETYDTVLEHYVTGIALRDDLDTQNRDLGREHLSLYADLVNQAIIDAAKNNVTTARAGKNTPPKYNRVI